MVLYKALTGEGFELWLFGQHDAQGLALGSSALSTLLVVKPDHVRMFLLVMSLNLLSLLWMLLAVALVSLPVPLGMFLPVTSLNLSYLVWMSLAVKFRSLSEPLGMFLPVPLFLGFHFLAVGLSPCFPLFFFSLLRFPRHGRLNA